MTGARQELHLPKFNTNLDDSEPDIWTLHRQDDSFVAAYSARGETKKSIIEAAKEDYRQLIQNLRALPSKATKEQQSI